MSSSCRAGERANMVGDCILQFITACYPAHRSASVDVRRTVWTTQKPALPNPCPPCRDEVGFRDEPRGDVAGCGAVQKGTEERARIKTRCVRHVVAMGEARSVT